jgi:hypothetical protein
MLDLSVANRSDRKDESGNGHDQQKFTVHASSFMI